MRLFALKLAVTVAVLASASAHAQEKANPQSSKKVKELQKERVEVLRDLAEQYAHLYKNGRVEVELLLEARVMLFQAEADGAEKQSDRIARLKRLVEELKNYEQIAQARVETARGVKASVLKVKARRLEVEIQLEQAGEAKAEAKSERATVGSPEVKNVTIAQKYDCEIRSQRHIKIRALQKGTIESISVKEGQMVRKGDTLFRLTPAVYKTRYDAEMAEVRIAELGLQNAERLLENKAVSAAEAALYRAKVERAKAKASLAMTELKFTEIQAPFDGIVDRFQEQEGSAVNDGDTLTTLSDNSAMWVYFNVPESRYLEYASDGGKVVGGNVELVLANGSKYEQSGKIAAIEAQFDNNTGKLPFRADFPNPDRVLRHGMSGNVLVRRTLNKAIVIPQRATLETDGTIYVYVVGKDNVARRIEVHVRNEFDGSFIVDRGLVGNERIIVEGIRQVRDGERVDFEVRSSEANPK